MSDDPDTDLQLSDVGRYYHATTNVARTALTAAQDADPEQASRALELSDATGVPSTAIYGDVDGFEKQNKAQMGSAIVQGNPYIADYLASHPMAPRISHDDLGQLDTASMHLADLFGDSHLGKWLRSDSVAKSFMEGFGDQPVGSSVLSRPQDLEFALSHPELGALAMTVATPVEFMARATSGLIHLGHDGLSQVFGESFANEAAAMAEWSMMRGDIGVHAEGGPFARVAQNEKLLDTMRETAKGLELADPWTQIGREPPVGIHPLIDEAKALQAKDDINALDAALKESVKSATRERSPEFYANFVRAHLGEREIGLDSGAIRSLYGDKQPEVGDNLLGWISELGKKLAAAELTGEDIRVPVADWLAKVEPEVAKQLHDDIRVRNNGLTLNETKVEAEPKVTGPNIVQQVRGSAGFEPLFSAGDRKIELRRTAQPGDATEGKFGPAQGFHDFDLHDETGKRIGMLNLSEQKGGKQLYIDMIQAGSEQSKFYQPNYLGPSAIRDIKRQLKQFFPNAETITGHRVSGAREAAGKEMQMPLPVVKLEVPRGWDSIEPMRQLLNGYWDREGTFEAYKGGDLTLDQQVLSEAIRKELERIVPSKVSEVSTPLAMRRAENQSPVGGAYRRSTTDWPRILVSLDREGASVGTARHEAIHHLRKYGFFNDTEWSTLERAARDEGWIKKYNIGERYSDLPMAAQLEEAVAEGYRGWAAGAKANDKVHPIFEKLKQFFISIKTAFKEATGRELDWDEIFKKVDTGEVGSREGKPLAEDGKVPFDLETKFDQEAPKAANDVDVKGLDRAGTYQAAAKKQQIEKLVKEDTERGDRDYWLKIAEKEGHLGITGKPNPFVAAREHSRDGKTTLHIGSEGNRTVFQDGVKAVRESFKDLPKEDFETKLSVEEPEGTEKSLGIYDRGKALGVTQAHMDRMLKLIEKRNAEDLDAANRRAELRQRRRSNREYKDRRTTLRDEVRQDLRQRPDVATGELFSKNKIKMNPAYLTEDQRARLPKEYLQKKDGVNPDDLAPYFGYTSGDALVERLGMLTSDRLRTGLSFRDYFNRLVDVETDRRLNQEFGNREQNILDEAKDQALSETQLNLVHEETLAYALKARGADFVPQFTKEQVRDMVRGVFNETPIGQISSDRLLQNAGKLGKRIEEAGSKGDWETAYRLSQQRNHTVIAAKFARDYEKARSSFDRTAKTFRKREVPSVPAEYTNWIHSILLSVERPINRSIQDLQENIGRQSQTTLRDFAEAKEAEWMGMRELPIADFLLDPNFHKNLSDLTHEEFMGLKNSVDTLAKAGRDEKKIYREGEAYDREQIMGEMRQKLESFGYKPSKAEPGPIGKWPKAFFYGLTNMETLLNRWDRADPRGVFQRMVMQPLASAANSKAKLQRDIAAKYKELSKPEDLDKLVDAPFVDPLTRTPANPDGTGWVGFNRGNVLQMLNHAGNKSNWKVLARGYGADPDALMQWLFKNTTKEDWDRAQKMGDTIFKGLIDKADNVYERMTGATIEKIKVEPIDTPYGQYKGWYHPLVADPVRKTVWVQDPDTGMWSQKAQGKKERIDDSDFLHFSTANGYTKRRTGAIYPLDLNFSLVPTRIKQMIHDISFREIIHDTQKIFSDARFQEDVAKYYGRDYSKGLMPYLRAVAGSEGIPSEGIAKASQLSEYLRQNVISSYIGFNPFTVLKHGPTAAVMSSREVGTANFFNAVKTLYGQAPSIARITHDFIMENSEEIGRRERHWQDTIAGQGREITGAGNLREKIIEKGSAAVAWSDMVSAKPTWLAAYNKYLGDGLSHGDSVALAERAVRRAHGSTAETNQPPLVRSGGPLHPWLTSVYGFFGTAMQRRIETAHKLNDAWQLGKDRQINAASKKLGSAFVDFMTYMVWPTIVEEAVTSIGSDDHRSWGSRLISGATMGAASSVLYLRDLIHGAVSGHEPGVGMLSSALHDVNNLVRDIGKGRDALSKEHAGKTVGDLLTVAGESTGMVPKIVGNAARYGINVARGQEKPKSVADILLGATKGTQKRRVEK